MNDHLFTKLDRADYFKAWSLVRNEIGEQLIGEFAMTVPHLVEAQSYDLYSVIVKMRLSPFEKISRKTPTLRSISHLRDLLTAESARDCLDCTDLGKKTDDTFNQDYTYHACDVRDGGKKLLDINLKGCGKYILRTPMDQHEFILDRDEPALHNAKKIYIVTAVYCVKSLRIQVQVRGQERTLALEGRIPIAFGYEKFELLKSGMVGLRLMVNMQAHLNAVWIRRSAFRDPCDSLPTAPSVESVSDLRAATRNPRDDLPHRPGEPLGPFTSRGLLQNITEA